MKGIKTCWHIDEFYNKSFLKLLTLLIFSNYRIAKLNKLSTTNFIHRSDTEIVLSVRDEVLDRPTEFVLARHDIDIGSPACFSALQDIVKDRTASIIVWRFPCHFAGVLGDITSNNFLAWPRET